MSEQKTTGPTPEQRAAFEKLRREGISADDWLNSPEPAAAASESGDVPVLTAVSLRRQLVDAEMAAEQNEERLTDKLESLRTLATTQAGEIAALVNSLKDMKAFVVVMYGDPDGNVPATLRTPLGVPVKIGLILTEARAALARAAAQTEAP